MQLTFDAENRIVQNYNTKAQNSTCYSYDGLGERVAKFAYGGNSCTGTAALTVAYVYDAFGNLAAESQTGSAPTPACLTCYLTWDHLGSVRMVSDAAAGGFTGFHDYAPFGEEVLSNAGRTADWGTAANGTDYLNQRYTGAERDTESTLDFLQARYLANQQGRFVSADPAGNFVADPGNPQSWNLYSYGLNNPLGFVDPSGLFTDCPGGTVVNNQCIQAPPPPPVDCGVLINSLFNPACGGVPQGPSITSNPQPTPQPPPTRPPASPSSTDLCLKASLVSALKGTASLGVARAKFSLAAVSLASTPTTGPVGVAGAVYGLFGAAGNVTAAGFQLVGSITGTDPCRQGGERCDDANYAGRAWCPRDITGRP